MNEPFIYIAAYRIKPEFRDIAPERLRDVARVVEEREPQVRSFHFYLDSERGRVICVQVHADSESMATHMATVAEHLGGAWDWLEPDNGEQLVLGTPPKVLTDYWLEFKEELTAYPTFVAGFARAGAPVGAAG